MRLCEFDINNRVFDFDLDGDYPADGQGYENSEELITPGEWHAVA
jgi:hypothetical protein